MAYATSSGKQMLVVMHVILVASQTHIKKQLAIYRVNLPELARQPTTNHYSSPACDKGVLAGLDGKGWRE